MLVTYLTIIAVFCHLVSTPWKWQDVKKASTRLALMTLTYWSIQLGAL